MRLVEAFPLEENPRIAFVGAGGKTSAIFRLAREARLKKVEKVFIAATTHFGVEQAAGGDSHTIIRSPAEVESWQGGAGTHVFTGEVGEDERTTGLTPEQIDAVEQLARRETALLLIEADGSRRKPLKAPADHEPVIPAWVNEVVVVAGMSGLGAPLDNAYIHRAEIFAQRSGLEIGQPVTVDALANVLLDEAGGLKGIPPQARRTVLLNQCDSDVLIGQAGQLADRLQAKYGQVILARLTEESENEVIAVRRRVAGVVLAAGGSERMGQPKQLLDWFGKPFVRVSAETALEAGLSPVVVVTGAAHAQVAEALAGLPVEVVENPRWAEGQATSVQAAMAALPESPAEAPLAVMFLLADQPQIPVRMVQTLVDAYAETAASVVAPLVDERRGNPVLFDRRTFDSLRGTHGDAGGRQIFARFPIHYVPWLDARAALDVDSPEDYQRLLRSFSEDFVP